MQLMKQKITLQNHQFSSVQSTIPSLLHTATALFMYRFLISFNDYDFVITNTGGLFCSNTSKCRQTEQQHKGHTWWGWLVISVSFPPTMRPSGISFIVLSGTPEVLTYIFIIYSTVYISSIKYKELNNCLCFILF